MATNTSKVVRAINLRPFEKLGGADHGWLSTRHHTSFAFYYDPNRMGWGDMRVWNDDTVKAGTGFDLHPHKNMEIISYVYEGAITHRDNFGNEGRTEAGDVQVMSAGTGVMHSEYNLEKTTCKFFQIWIKPNSTGHKPTWGSRKFPKSDRAGKFVVLASGFDDDIKQSDALHINTESRVLGATLEPGQSTEYHLGADRLAYLVTTKGKMTVNGQVVNAHDGLAVKDTDVLTFEASEETEIVMVDTVPEK